MKLASLKSGGRDGTLIVVDRAVRRAVAVPEHAPTLQTVLDEWVLVAPALEDVYARLNADPSMGFELDPDELAAPLPLSLIHI